MGKYHGANEEGCGQGNRGQANDQRHDYQGVGRAARFEAEGVLGIPQLLGGDRLPGGEEDRYLHTSRTLQDQDPHKAGHEGRSEEYFRQRSEGCRQTGEEGGESLPSACSEAADLDQFQKEEMIAPPEAQLMWESHRASLEGAP